MEVSDIETEYRKGKPGKWKLDGGPWHRDPSQDAASAEC